VSRADRIVREFLRGRASPQPTGVTWGPEEELAVEALAVLADRNERRLNRVTPVATTPRSALGARRSDAVLRDLIASATNELVVLGYEVSDRGIITGLAERASLGVSVDLLVDAKQTPLSRLSEAWPRGAATARVWTTAFAEDGKPYRLHAKAVIADGRRCMLGSANLTYSGLHTNLELGVLLEGPVAKRFRRHVSEMIRRNVVTQAMVLGMTRAPPATPT
jgi:phosphatidylserine/phosphatidylglycerophosphate/cardiolipin synthase-like enzyme